MHRANTNLHYGYGQLVRMLHRETGSKHSLGSLRQGLLLMHGRMMRRRHVVAVHGWMEGRLLRLLLLLLLGGVVWVPRSLRLLRRRQVGRSLSVTFWWSTSSAWRRIVCCEGRRSSVVRRRMTAYPAQRNKGGLKLPLRTFSASIIQNDLGYYVWYVPFTGCLYAIQFR